VIIDENTLAHYGTKRHSGRYPWGSGGDTESRSPDFLTFVDGLKKQGFSEKQIAGVVGGHLGNEKFNTSDLRAMRRIELNARKAAQVSQAVRLKNKGMSNVAIGTEMKLPESTVRNLLKDDAKLKVDRLTGTADMLKSEVAKKKYIDVGLGVEHHLGVSRGVLNTSVKMLEQQGYKKHYVNMPQLGTRHETRMIILTKDTVSYSELMKNKDKISLPGAHTINEGVSFEHIHAPVSVSSRRVGIAWKEDGGAKADGIIYLRPGVPDLSLGKSRYAQVRIAVDGTHYLKGMAMYKDDMPKGTDIIFNTNKPRSASKHDAMKKMNTTADGTVDAENPFTAMIRRQHGVLNIVNEEGAWGEWSKTISSQMLSKQKPTLAKAQLDALYEQNRKELGEISKLTNPAIRKKLLISLADSADSHATKLDAMGLPRTANHVILPLTSIKENEIYAPNYDNGTVVALIRHPHGGRFEIPELTVNNKNREGKRVIGSDAKDAVGIHHKVAEKLSGADFDGDTVLVIPNNHRKIGSEPSLKELKGFDPKSEYPKYPGMKVLSEENKQIEMGKISNLITDMTILGAPNHEIARAVKHSMVVIDATKHELNYKKSEHDNGIAALKEKWQGPPGKQGAATLISRAGSVAYVPQRKPNYDINKRTGEKIFKETGKTKTITTTNKRTGVVTVKQEPVMQRSKKLFEAKDARKLISKAGTPIEHVYAEHSNKLKALSNEARKEAANTKSLKYSPSARKAYAAEYADLAAQLKRAQMNAPIERQAQVLGNALYKAMRDSNPNMDKDQLKTARFKALKEARARVGADKYDIKITPRHWEAIQAGAVTQAMLEKILEKTDLDAVRQYATPKRQILMTSTNTNRARSMLNAGYTQAEVAKHLGVSLTTLKTALNKEG